MKLRSVGSTVALAVLLVASGCSSGPPRGAVRGNPVSPSPTNVAAIPTTTVPTSPTAGAASPSGPCTGAAPPDAVTHVVWIIMENRGLRQIDGSGSAPYINRLGRQCGVATDYSGVAHPSLPNYIALTSGSTQGITDDAEPAGHRLAVPSIFSLLGPGWRALAESMPTNCDRTTGGRYAARHNPAVYYTNIAAACAAQDVPLGPVPDLSARFTIITPDVCSDMHDCSTATGDRWLAGEVPQILGSAGYRSGSTVLFITWDENDSGGALVPTYVIAPSVPPATRSSQPFDHYSLLRTTEDLLGLRPLLGKAAAATDMSPAFHL
ncbi:MAG TPA: alkaline phosphatase family protein [Acidimicrobiales bacterium]|nr:alkaline phosphatase family protein [Acidimicrobiales bacterium]